MSIWLLFGFSHSFLLPVYPLRYFLRGNWEILTCHIREPILVTTDLLSQPRRQVENLYRGLLVNLHVEGHFQVKRQRFRVPGGDGIWREREDCSNYSADVGGTTSFIEYLPRNNSDWNYQGVKSVNGVPCNFWRQKFDPTTMRPDWFYEFYAEVNTSRPVRYLVEGQRDLDTHPTRYAFDIDSWGPTIDEAQFFVPPNCQLFSSTRSRRAVSKVQPTCVNVTSVPIDEVPDNFSWRAVPNVLPRVRDQSVCGSCWAQGSSEAISAQLSLRLNSSVEHSVQQIIDCTWGGANFACDGGSSWDSFGKLAARKLPLATETEYPYVGVGGLCATTYRAPLGFGIDSKQPCRQFIPPVNDMNHKLLKKAVYVYGPLAVEIHSGEEEFMMLGPEKPYYSNNNCNVSTWGNRTMIDHIVLLTGWQTYNNTKYLEIQNSWSEKWGADGFGYIDEKKDCGIQTMAVLPNVVHI
jgi:C1A family cysteine protease